VKYGLDTQTSLYKSFSVLHGRTTSKKPMTAMETDNRTGQPHLSDIESL